MEAVAPTPSFRAKKDLEEQRPMEYKSPYENRASWRRSYPRNTSFEDIKSFMFSSTEEEPKSLSNSIIKSGSSDTLDEESESEGPMVLPRSQPPVLEKKNGELDEFIIMYPLSEKTLNVETEVRSSGYGSDSENMEEIPGTKADTHTSISPLRLEQNKETNEHQDCVSSEEEQNYPKQNLDQPSTKEQNTEIIIEEMQVQYIEKPKKQIEKVCNLSHVMTSHTEDIDKLEDKVRQATEQSHDEDTKSDGDEETTKQLIYFLDEVPPNQISINVGKTEKIVIDLEKDQDVHTIVYQPPEISDDIMENIKGNEVFSKYHSIRKIEDENNPGQTILEQKYISQIQIHVADQEIESSKVREQEPTSPKPVVKKEVNEIKQVDKRKTSQVHDTTQKPLQRQSSVMDIVNAIESGKSTKKVETKTVNRRSWAEKPQFTKTENSESVNLNILKQNLRPVPKENYKTVTNTDKTEIKSFTVEKPSVNQNEKKVKKGILKKSTFIEKQSRQEEERRNHIPIIKRITKTSSINKESYSDIFPERTNLKDRLKGLSKDVAPSFEIDEKNQNMIRDRTGGAPDKNHFEKNQTYKEEYVAEEDFDFAGFTIRSQEKAKDKPEYNENIAVTVTLRDHEELIEYKGIQKHDNLLRFKLIQSHLIKKGESLDFQFQFKCPGVYWKYKTDPNHYTIATPKAINSGLILEILTS